MARTIAGPAGRAEASKRCVEGVLLALDQPIEPLDWTSYSYLWRVPMIKLVDDDACQFIDALLMEGCNREFQAADSGVVR